MKQITAFFDWLFHCDTPDAFGVLFILGAGLGSIVGAVVLAAFYPLVAVTVFFAIVFGVPLLGYKLHLEKERSK